MRLLSAKRSSINMRADEAATTQVVHKEHAPDPAAVASGEVQFDPPKPLVRPEDLRLRSERQTLRRMPKSGAILFTVRT